MAAKKRSTTLSQSSQNPVEKYKHMLIPSSVGGVVAYIFSGVVMLGLVVFAAVWVGNMIGHALHKKK